MHGSNSPSAFLVNAEVDSMGGVAEGLVGNGKKSSPHQTAIQKVQAELRQECDVREERKRELEFLEKGGNPLDFKFGSAASIRVLSNSVSDQHHAPFATRKARCTVAVTTSQHGDSVESRGGPTCEPNTADNLLLFDTEHEFSEGYRSSLYRSKADTAASEQSSKMDGSHKAREPWDSDASGVPRKAYRRRNRSRPNRDGTGSTSADINTARGSNGSSLPSRGDEKGSTADAVNQNLPSNDKSKPTSPTHSSIHKTVTDDVPQDMELDSVKDVLTKDLNDGVKLDPIASQNQLEEHSNQLILSDVTQAPILIHSNGPKSIMTMEDSAVMECQPGFTATDTDNQVSSLRINDLGSENGDGMTNSRRSSYSNNHLDSKPSHIQANTHLTINENNDSEVCTEGHVDFDGKIKSQTSMTDRSPLVETGDIEGKKETVAVSSTVVIEEGTSDHHSQAKNAIILQVEEELNGSQSAVQPEVANKSSTGRMNDFEHAESEAEKKPLDNVGNQDSVDKSISELAEAVSLTGPSIVSAEVKSSVSELKIPNEVDEDSILREAQIIEAKRKRILELSTATTPMESRRKSQWDYVLEEMAWLANDFAQERIWKTTAASQLCYRVAFTCHLRKQEKSSGRAVKKIAHTLAKSVIEFWHSVKERSKEFKQQSEKDGDVSIQAYAVRFLNYNNSNVIHEQAEMPITPDRVSDLGNMDLSWEDNLTEETLFYVIPPGVMATYRKSIESHVALCVTNGSSALEEVDTSVCDDATDFDSQDNAYYEDEGESTRSARLVHKKQKHSTQSYGRYPDLMPIQYAENKAVSQQFSLPVKRPSNSLNVSIPTKRVRTASRRVISPFSAGTSGYLELPNRADASSGDTNSFQDDQNTLRGGSIIPNNSGANSAGDFESQLPFDYAEVSTKPKKKKTKHPNIAYEEKWQLDSNVQLGQFQQDNLKKRVENPQLESNGGSGLFGHTITKKPKIMRQSHDNNYLGNSTPIGGHVPSPVASQMSNMPNPNKFIKMLGGRDRGRKLKALKVNGGQPGSGGPWLQIEDQALVVLVHDLGPNWELVSDALNSTLHFTCVFRKAKECKERHNFLIDRSPGDGGDSAEDSGSSQPYPSTLPGIPKGSARQLFQRVQGPVEEDSLKFHFEKILTIGKQHKRKNQEPKQYQQPHSSHMMALSQLCLNNLNREEVLTPLDLCDTTISGSDILPLGYQGPLSGGLDIPSQAAVSPAVPASGVSSVLQGSPNMVLGNNFSPSPGTINNSARDVRYGVPRSAPLSVDEQHRLQQQQYNHMISSRNIPQPNTPAPGTLPGADRGVRVLPGGNGMGMVCGVNRGMPVARPGGQGIASPSMLNSVSVGSPVLPSAAMHSGQGSSMMRPREALQLMRPAQSQESPKQMGVSDVQMTGNSQGVLPHFGGIHHQLPNPMSPQQPQLHHPHFQGPVGNHAQQQTYAARMAKERQLQQRFLQQHSPHFAGSQPQPPISSPPMQINSPVSLSPSTPSSSITPMPQKKKHPVPNQLNVRPTQVGGSPLTNQTGKQRQKQQLSQANRQHPQQRQYPQPQQQQTKNPKGVGRGNPMMIHQNISVDPSLMNGVSANSGKQQNLSPQASTQQKMYTGQALSPSKHLHQKSDYVSQEHALPVGHTGSNHLPLMSHKTQVHLQRVVQENSNVKSEPNIPQTTDFDSDQHRFSGPTEMNVDPTNTGQIIPPLQRQLSDAQLDSKVVNPRSSVPRPSTSNELSQQAGQELDQRLQVGSPSMKHDIREEWQDPPQPSHIPQPQSPLSTLHSNQQVQLLQAGNGNLYGRDIDPRLE